MKQWLLMALWITGLTLFSFGQEPVQIGAIGEEGELIYPRLIAEGPDGNIYVYDQSDAYIKIYSPEGRYLRKFGGEGQGPGEIQRKEGVSFGFTPDEEPVCLPDGRYLTKFNLIAKPKREKDYFYHIYPQQIILLDPAGIVLSRSKRSEYISRISYESMGADAPVPFTPMFAWCPYKEDTLLFSDGLSTKLQVYDFEGNLVEEISTPLPEPRKVTNADLKSWRDGYAEMMRSRNPDWFNRFGKVITNYKKSLHNKHVNLSDLTRTPGVNIFISGPQDDNGAVDTYWLLDSSGKELTTLKTTAQGIRVSKNYVFFGLVDEDGVVSVTALKKSGSEQEDLQKLAKLAPTR